MLNRIIALLLLIFLSPVFLLVSLAIIVEDGFLVFFQQKRVERITPSSGYSSFAP
jgi:lipopolysaccharide/colanic/teichoic acid biosynthesis glycosyltransferase